jgi:hypothetical protein
MATGRYFTAILTCLCGCITLAQTTAEKPPLSLSSDAIKETYFPGDTISFRVTNQSTTQRGFIIDVVTTEDYQSSDKIFYRELFTAFFNNDTAFIRKLKLYQRESKSSGNRYRTPELTPVTYELEPGRTRKFAFVVKGNRRLEGIRLQLRVIPDLNGDEPETISESKPFAVFATPL